jgi:hypothetical protein
MGWFQTALNFIVEQVLAAFIAVLFGLVVAFLTSEIWDRWRYGKWHVVILKGGKTLVDRRISPRKVKEILGETSDKAVFLKGVTSPYDWLNCDIIEDGEKLGLLTEDHKQHRMIVNLDHNPPPNKQRVTRG